MSHQTLIEKLKCHKEFLQGCRLQFENTAIDEAIAALSAKPEPECDACMGRGVLPATGFTCPHCKPEPTKAERLAALIAERDALLTEDDKPEPIPLEPTAAMIDAGAQRLVNCGEGNSKWPDDYRPIDVRNARNEAERVWRSMWLAYTPPEPAKPMAERVEEWIKGASFQGTYTPRDIRPMVLVEDVRTFLATLTAEHQAELAAKEAAFKELDEEYFNYRQLQLATAQNYLGMVDKAKTDAIWSINPKYVSSVINNNQQDHDVILRPRDGETIPVATMMIACPHPDLTHDCCIWCGMNMLGIKSARAAQENQTTNQEERPC